MAAGAVAQLGRDVGTETVFQLRDDGLHDSREIGPIRVAQDPPSDFDVHHGAPVEYAEDVAGAGGALGGVRILAPADELVEADVADQGRALRPPRQTLPAGP